MKDELVTEDAHRSVDPVVDDDQSDRLIESDVGENVALNAPDGVTSEDSMYQIKRAPRRTDAMFEGFSRIEKHPDESMLLSSTKAVHFEQSSIQSDSEVNKEVMYDFSCMIQGDPYLVSVYRLQDALFAMFFAIATGLTRLKRLGSAWKNPPVPANDADARLAWFRENIASVLLNSRGPEATPRRPPKRAPPQAIPEGSHESDRSTLSSASISADHLSRLETDLFTANERIKQLEQSTRQQEERSVAEVNRLREELSGSKELLKENAERFRVLSDEYEGRLQDWRKRFTESQSEAQVSQQEWKQIIAQREADLARVRQESSAEVEKMKSKLSEAETAMVAASAAAALARPAEFTPSKRQKIEDEVWAEAEKILAMARADVKEMTQAKQRAEQYAESKKLEALEAIATCEKIVKLKASEAMVLKHQYDSLVMEKQGIERSLKDSKSRCSSLEEELVQVRLQLEHEKGTTGELVKQLTEYMMKG